MNFSARVVRLDDSISRVVQPARSSRVLGAATAVLSIGGDTLLVALLALRATRAESPRVEAGLLGGTLLAEQAVAGTLKHALRRGRPHHTARPPVALHPSGPAFPSGHSSSGFYIATALADRSSAPLLYLGAALVAVARLHQGVHRASDLAVGALIGATGGGAARLLAARYGRGQAGQ